MTSSDGSINSKIEEKQSKENILKILKFNTNLISIP